MNGLRMTTRGALGLDPDELVACVSCGLCLPHCPTYRVTGLELASPRGRIAAMRVVDSGAAPLDAVFVRAMDECVQCRGCEAACPSGVPFGHLMESTRAAIAPRRPRLRRLVETLGYRGVLAHHRVLVAVSWLLLVAQRLRLVPRRYAATLPRLDMRRLALRLRVPAGGTPDVWLFTGCVMDAWMRETHIAAARVVRATGARPAVPGRGGDCCGALHVHAGRTDDARRLARRVIASMPGAAPVLVDSAGCGAALRDYGHLLGTPEAAAFAARVVDISSWLAQQPLLPLRPGGGRVVVQDPCHLRHVQRDHAGVRTVLGPAYELVETDDDGLCCGAGGAYAALQPALANDVRARKVAALARTGASVVCSANPGCTIHLRAAGLEVRHPVELLADALEESPR